MSIEVIDSLFIPWSCRESFTEEVCGLPSEDGGCWRYQRHIDGGIGPGEDVETRKQIAAWLVIGMPQRTSAAAGQPPRARLLRQAEVPDRTLGSDEMLFGFTKDGLGSKPLAPSRLMFRCGKDGTKVVRWSGTGDDQPETSLQHYFGSDTFSLTNVDTGKPETSFVVRPAELISAYLDHRCKPYRGHRLGMETGIMKCHLEVAQAAQAAPPRIGVSFTYINPATNKLEKLRDEKNNCNDLDFGCLYPAEAIGLPDRFDRRTLWPYVKRMEVASHKAAIVDEINYADCFSEAGRRYILPTEVGQSFLKFPIEEIATYLLHWTVLRILADPEANESFTDKFRTWTGRVNAQEDSYALFVDLLSLPIVPVIDRAVFEQVPDVPGDNRLSALVGGHSTTLSQILKVIGLGEDQHQTIERVVGHLQQFIGGVPKPGTLPSLPMYKDLEWAPSRLLNQAGDSPQRLEGILASCFRAPTWRGGDSASIALQQLPLHSKRSVFPFGHVLSHWPDDNAVNNYFIFPIWEDEVRGWHRPVVFAHVFAALDGAQHQPSPVYRELQRHLLPMGSTIAHSYYDQIRKDQEVSKAKLLLMGVAAHSANNLLMDASIEPLVETLTYGNPPEGLRFDFHAGANVSSKTTLDRIRSLGLASRKFRNLMALTEMVGGQGVLKKKLQFDKGRKGPQAYSLLECLQEAERMLDSSRKIDTDVAVLILRPASPQDREVLCRIHLPRYYLSNDLISTWIYEILLNSARHGMRDKRNACVPAFYTAQFDNDVGTFQVLNFVPRDQEWYSQGSFKQNKSKKGEYENHGFLVFSSILAHYIQGIKISSDVEGIDDKSKYLRFVTTLELAPVKSEKMEKQILTQGPRTASTRRTTEIARPFLAKKND